MNPPLALNNAHTTEVSWLDPGVSAALLGQAFHARQIGVAAAGYDVVVCEVNSDPPNPASDALHAALGFTEVGAASIHGGAKTVRYLALPLSPARGTSLPLPR